VVVLPGFRLERAGFSVTDCAGLVAESKNALRLIALTPHAVRQGLREGMSAAEARARVPEVRLVDHDPAAEVRDRDDLLRAFDAISDRATFLWHDALAFDLSTVAHLFGGERRAAERAVALAGELGHVARAAVADDALAARALARWALPDGGVRVVPAGGGTKALAELPVEALEPDESLRQGLRAIGIATVGQWAKLDAASVAGRFPGATRLHRVACGEPGAWVHLAADGPDTAPLRSLAALPGATTRQEIHFVLPGLLSELCERLAARDLAVVRLLVEFRLEARGPRGATRAVVGVRIGRPTQSPSRLAPLVQQRIGAVSLDAPVEELAIEAIEVVPEQGWQPGLTDRREATEPLPELLARLADQLGPHALFAGRPVDRWRPEAAWRPEPFPPPRLWPEPAGAAEALASDDPVAIQEAFEAPEVLPRPSFLLPKPVPIDVETARRGRPATVSVGGRAHRCARVAGPERLVGEWWCDDPLDRTYWTVEVDGRTAWIYQEGPRWFLHGWFG